MHAGRQAGRRTCTSTVHHYSLAFSPSLSTPTAGRTAEGQRPRCKRAHGSISIGLCSAAQREICMCLRYAEAWHVGWPACRRCCCRRRTARPPPLWAATLKRATTVGRLCVEGRPQTRANGTRMALATTCMADKWVTHVSNQHGLGLLQNMFCMLNMVAQVDKSTTKHGCYNRIGERKVYLSLEGRRLAFTLLYCM